MTTPIEQSLPLLRLMHLVSPSLPVGGFTYSQGIEWAVEDGWIKTAEDLSAWLEDQLHTGLVGLDLPLLLRMQRAVDSDHRDGLAHWIDFLLASRETSELRAEEQNRGRALADLLSSLQLPDSAHWKPLLSRSQLAGFAFAAGRWAIPAEQAAMGYAWSWLENLTLAAVKIIPLGQTQGQQLLHRLTPMIPEILAAAAGLEDDELGASNPALAIASSLHETQYTRLFRS